MGLFDKKFCDVCGEKIGLLGNRKLEDGNLCKDCAGKLSVWFNDRRHTTLSGIKEQLADREANRAKANAFVMTKFFGDCDTVIMFDENRRTFAVCSKKDMPEGNPDIIELSRVTYCSPDAKEYKKEITYKDGNGNTQSYNPKRYEYSYDFYYEIHVNHPYIDEIRFRLNSMKVELREATKGEQVSSVLGILAGQNNTIVTQNPQYDKYVTMGQEITGLIEKYRNETTGTDPRMQAEMAARQAMSFAQNTVAPQAAEQTNGPSWYCSNCGTKNEGTGHFCCSCGTKRG